MHHDLPVADLTLSTVETPIGALTIACADATIVICEFADHGERVTRQLRRYYSGAHIKSGTLPTPISDRFGAYFGGDCAALDTLKTAPAGTDFQRRVWAQLRKISAGGTTHYGAMAREMNSSPRAVGGANGRNPVALIHPCHRVIGADGSLTGYAGGLARKEWLLQHEGALLTL
jgi:methylated-DNA-[protein]-cysteine S-methyltransferase